MNMNINNINTNKVTVKTSSISKIKIPMIQRDYVQGLKNEKLEPFLNTLIDALLNGQKLSLDFIYGNINEDGVFEPIDGQQRLTTLALLTFYLYCRQKGSDNNKTLNNPFKYITYATRQSAKKFCELLAEYEYTDKFENKTPSNVIKENSKYFREYNEDTTISAMLKTLDKIHEIINDKKPNINNNTGQDDIQSFINTLASNIDKINFHILPMESFNLSDDLYIKMNGRGKQLSSFDNFKADYFKWLEDASDDNIDKLIPDSFGENSIDKLNTLKRKFDTDYIYIFWDYAIKNSEDTDEIPDPEKLFFRFINRFVVGKILSIINNDKNEEYKQYINQFLSCNEKFRDFTPEEQDNVIDIFIKNVDTYFFSNKGSKTEDNSIEYSNFDFYGFILLKYNSKLINILDNLYIIKNNNYDCFLNKISEYFKAGWEKEFNIFNDFKNYKELFVYNTILSFLENRLSEEYIEKEIQCLSRLVWNVAEQYDLAEGVYKNTYISTANRFNFLSEIYMDDTNNSNNNYDIYNCFIKANKDYNQAGSSLKHIVCDEVKKCQYIFKKPELEQKFIELESLDYLHGITGFLLDNEIDFDTNHQDYLDIFNNIDKVTYDDHKMYNINNNNKLLVRLLIYKLYKSGEYTIHNKYFSDTFIRTELIANTVFRKHMHDLIIDIIKNGYQYNLPKINEIEIDINALNRKYNPYFRDSIISILYDKIDNEYIINKHYIDTSVAPCIEHNKYFNKSYKKYKRLGSIIVEQHVCDMVNYIVTTDGIQFNNDEKPEKINYSCEDNSQERKAYKHLIYYNNGHLIIYFKIKDRRYSVWFIYQDNQVGITDETDQNNKKELKKQYSNEKFNEEDFKTDVDTIKQMIKMLVDNNITLADLYNDKISDGFYKR